MIRLLDQSIGKVSERFIEAAAMRSSVAKLDRIVKGLDATPSCRETVASKTLNDVDQVDLHRV